MTDTDYETRVVNFPGTRGLTAMRRTAATAAGQPLAQTGVAVDDWGRDPELIGVVNWFSRLRWRTLIGGKQHLPARGGALVVVNNRRGSLAAPFVALALSHAMDRPVRFVGRPDTAPVGAFARRLGGLLDRPDEVAGALRAGELVVLASSPEFHPRRVGRVDHRIVAAAVSTATSVYPAALATSPWARNARVEIGPAARSGRKRRGPLTELELADQVERRIGRLLAELGGMQTGTLLDWLPFSGMGAG
ncbi:MAG: hypothetical protein ACK5OX_10435 [Desertimonas sp.]